MIVAVEVEIENIDKVRLLYSDDGGRGSTVSTAVRLAVRRNQPCRIVFYVVVRCQEGRRVVVVQSLEGHRLRDVSSRPKDQRQSFRKQSKALALHKIIFD